MRAVRCLTRLAPGPTLGVALGTAVGLLLLAAVPAATAFTWPWDLGGPWPTSSGTPVTPWLQPALGAHHQSPHSGIPSSYRFVAFGDQRALADGEWQELLGHVGLLTETDPGLLFLIDTGDIINDGRHSDQFAMLRTILQPVAHLPYWVGVGNHELYNNASPRARENTARFLGQTAPGLAADRLYYRKDVGSVRFLFLDTNDLVYGEGGAGFEGAGLDRRAIAQLDWLVGELATDSASVAGTVVVVMHHPLIQSSRKHRAQARALWSLRHGERTLPDILLDGGVDLLLSGHTHTYERFRLQRADGRRMHLVNLSGRPRTDFLWIGDGSRRARDISGREVELLSAWGWQDLGGWRISQEAAMYHAEANQFGRFAVDEHGGITLQIYYLDEDRPNGIRRDPPVGLD